jgi:hypothetical protein
MNVETEERPDSAEAKAERTAAEASAGAVLSASATLFNSVQRTAAALLALVKAEAQVVGASVGLIVLSGVALVAFAVALWVCVVALIGWALAVATHSVGIALGILVVMHLLLVAGIWIAIRHAIYQATFPRTRAEFSELQHGLRQDLARFQRAPVAPDEDKAP